MKVVVLDGGVLPENVEFSPILEHGISDSIAVEGLCKRICATVEHYSRDYSRICMSRLHTQTGEEL